MAFLKIVGPSLLLLTSLMVGFLQNANAARCLKNCAECDKNKNNVEVVYVVHWVFYFLAVVIFFLAMIEYDEYES